MNPQKPTKNGDRARWGLNITDQEISESLAIDLEDLKNDKETGEISTSISPIIAGWWSNNWYE